MADISFVKEGLLDGKFAEEAGSSTEKTVKFYLDAFRPYVLETVDAKELCIYYDLLTKAQKREITSLYKTSKLDAADKFLEFVEESAEPGKYTELKTALEDAEYPKLVKVLDGAKIPSDSNHQRVIQLFARQVVKRIKPSQLLPGLVSKAIINRPDDDLVKAEEQSTGEYHAAYTLLCLLPNRNEDWFKGFLEVLMDSGEEVLAKEIDPDLCHKLKVQREHAASISSVDDSLTSEKEGYSLQSGPSSQEYSLDKTGVKVEKVDKEVRVDCLEASGGPAESFNDLNATPFESGSSGRMDAFYRSLDELANTENTEVKTTDSENTSLKIAAIDDTEVKVVQGTENTPVKMVAMDNTEVKVIQGSYTNDHNMVNPAEKPLKDKDVDLDGNINLTDDKKVNTDRNIVEEEGAGSLSSLPVTEPEEEEIPDEDISLRQYQSELAGPALQGKNVIIVAPTGSGKTRVALKIIQEHMRRLKGRRIPKVIFLVNQVALANQQGEACSSQLKKYKTKIISGESQRTKNESLKDFVGKRDILVVTAQVLLDALVKKEVDCVSQFSLMVFDECHHTHANHTFNQIMSMYMDLKLEDGFDLSTLPQIVGLTASVGVGKAKNMEKAVDHIKSLMANLDAQQICTVQNNMDELRSHVSVPEEETCTVPRRENDVFGQGVTKVMEIIERMMTQSPVMKTIIEQEPRFEGILKAPAQKGCPQYTQWVSKLWKETAKLRSQEGRRFLNPCRAHLEYYNNALMVYNDARVEDALEYLDTSMERWQQNAIMDPNETKLKNFYDKTKTLPFHSCSPNPKLKKLREMVVKAYAGEKGKDSRGIIFVKTRALAKAIINWMKQTPQLKELNPTEFLGQTAQSDGGMTKNEQHDVLKFFRDGKHKLIVATSVAEEGLDISKCNLVIRYDHVTNEIAMVQSRGRGRAQDSKYFVLAEHGSGHAEKEELNMMREILMRKAIIHVQEDVRKGGERFLLEIRKLQEDAKIDRELKSLTRRGRRIRDGEFELRCMKCNEFICMSSDIKKVQNAHHVVVDDTLQERVRMIRYHSPRVIDETIQINGKMFCSVCGYDLGTICIHRSLDFPVLKISCFLVVDMVGRQDTFKKWKDVCFEVNPLVADDFKSILEKVKSSGFSLVKYRE